VVDAHSKRETQTLLIILAIIVLLSMRPVLAQTTYYFLIGATGDKGSRGNIGVAAEIRINSYKSQLYLSDTGEKLASDAFFVREYFTDGSAIFLGYYNYLGQVQWDWQRINPFGELEDAKKGLADSLGPNGTWHSFTIEYDDQSTLAGRVWDFRIDGSWAGETKQTEAESNAATQPIFFGGEAFTRNASGIVLGPVEFRSLSYLTLSGWQQVKSLTVTQACWINNEVNPPCDVSVPYGVSELGANHIIVGSALPMHANGEILWTTNPLDYVAPYFGQILVLVIVIGVAIFGIRWVPLGKLNWKSTISGQTTDKP
jgi:hypothetical protein